MTHRIAVKGHGFASTDTLRRLRSAVRRALRNERVPYRCRVDIRLADDAFLRRVNTTARGIRKATDVLSFPDVDWAAGEEAKPDPEDRRVFLGEILISAERAAAQAARFGHDFDRELCYLAVHGVLHLLGFDHEEKAEKALMRTKEEAALCGLRLET